MTISLWVTVIGLAVSVIVQIIMGYLHRKQMRQNELFRVDPKAGLIPPPHPVTVFLGRYWPLFVQLPGAAYLLLTGFINYLHYNALQSGVPFALGLGFLTWALLSHLIARLTRLAERIVGSEERLTFIGERHEERLAKHDELIKKIVEVVQLQESKRSELEKLLVDPGAKKPESKIAPGKK